AVGDRMLVILPFEEEIYRRAGVRVEFGGRPRLELAHPPRSREQTLRPLGLDPGRPTVALLPGSRRNELSSHLHVMLGAGRRLQEEFRDLQFLLPIAPTLVEDEVERILRAEQKGAEGAGVARAALDCRLVRGGRYDAGAACGAPRVTALAGRASRSAPGAAGEMRRGLSGVRSRLGRPGAIERVAATAWDMIGGRVSECEAAG